MIRITLPVILVVGLALHPCASFKPGKLQIRGGHSSMHLRGGRSPSESGVDYTKMKIPELVNQCKTKGLPTHGNKNEVIKR